jgi:hypothetical protein
MDSKIRQNELKTCPTAYVSQIQVRSDVRSGGDLETCQFNLNKWRERYYYWYDVARQKGKI